MAKLIIFDYDGVIVDSLQNVFEVYNIICKKLNKRAIKNLAEFIKIYGYKSTEAYRNLGISIKEREPADIIYKEEILKKESRLFKGIKEVIEELSKKYKLILVSSAYKDEIVQKLKKFEILKYFDLIIGKETHGKRLNKANPIKELIQKDNLDVNDIILIGDRDVDYNSGIKAGLKHIILVDYGWGHSQKKKTTIKKPRDILKAVSEIWD
ncbi:MAG: HAD-IA family hydrolase [Candidatus Nanoarchaeia archaeon]|nr:HAD-IA family hydrolase [Candidatus Nanoarchaeia archaeon]